MKPMVADVLGTFNVAWLFLVSLIFLGSVVRTLPVYIRGIRGAPPDADLAAVVGEDAARIAARSSRRTYESLLIFFTACLVVLTRSFVFGVSWDRVSLAIFVIALVTAMLVGAQASRLRLERLIASRNHVEATLGFALVQPPIGDALTSYVIIRYQQLCQAAGVTPEILSLARVAVRGPQILRELETRLKDEGKVAPPGPPVPAKLAAMTAEAAPEQPGPV